MQIMKEMKKLENIFLRMLLRYRLMNELKFSNLRMHFNQFFKAPVKEVHSNEGRIFDENLINLALLQAIQQQKILG